MKTIANNHDDENGLRFKGGVPDLYFIFDKSISCNNLAKTWDRNLEFGILYLHYM